MEWWVILVIVLGAPLMLLPVVLIWYLNIAGTVQLIRDRRYAAGAREVASTLAETLFCRIDADCPPGYVCVDGRCVPAK